MTGRAISGYGVGVGMPATAIYIAEVSSPQMRGKLSSLPALLMALGVLLGYLLGGLRDYNRSPSHVHSSSGHTHAIALVCSYWSSVCSY